jgi:hypothetical protein
MRGKRKEEKNTQDTRRRLREPDSSSENKLRESKKGEKTSSVRFVITGINIY